MLWVVMACLKLDLVLPSVQKKNVQQKSNLMLTTTSLPFNDSHAPTGLPSARTCCAPARWGLMPPDFFSLWQWWTWLFHCIGQLGTNKKWMVVKLIRNPFIIPWITHNRYTWMNLKTRAYHRNPSDITSSRKFCTESMKRKRFPHGNSADLLFGALGVCS